MTYAIDVDVSDNTLKAILDRLDQSDHILNRCKKFVIIFGNTTYIKRFLKASIVIEGNLFIDKEKRILYKLFDPDYELMPSQEIISSFYIKKAMAKIKKCDLMMLCHHSAFDNASRFFIELTKFLLKVVDNDMSFYKAFHMCITDAPPDYTLRYIRQQIALITESYEHLLSIEQISFLNLLTQKNSKIFLFFADQACEEILELMSDNIKTRNFVVTGKSIDDVERYLLLQIHNLMERRVIVKLERFFEHVKLHHIKMIESLNFSNAFSLANELQEMIDNICINSISDMVAKVEIIQNLQLIDYDQTALNQRLNFCHFLEDLAFLKDITPGYNLESIVSFMKETSQSTLVAMDGIVDSHIKTSSRILIDKIYDSLILEINLGTLEKLYAFKAIFQNIANLFKINATSNDIIKVLEKLDIGLNGNDYKFLALWELSADKNRCEYLTNSFENFAFESNSHWLSRLNSEVSKTCSYIDYMFKKFCNEIELFCKTDIKHKVNVLGLNTAIRDLVDTLKKDDSNFDIILKKFLFVVLNMIPTINLSPLLLINQHTKKLLTLIELDANVSLNLPLLVTLTQLSKNLSDIEFVQHELSQQL